MLTGNALARVQELYTDTLHAAIKVGEAEARGEEPDHLHQEMLDEGLRALARDTRLTEAERDEVVAEILAERIAAAYVDEFSYTDDWLD